MNLEVEKYVDCCSVFFLGIILFDIFILVIQTLDLDGLTILHPLVA